MRLPNGYGSIVKRKERRRKPYIVRKTIDGKRVTIGWTETKEEAMQLLSEVNENPEIVQNRNKTVDDIFELWLKYKAPQLSKDTVRSNKNRYKTYFGPIKHIPYRNLRLADFLDLIESADTTPGGKNNLRKFLHSLDEVAYNMDIINKKYTQNIPVYETEGQKRIPFSEKEIAMLWENKHIEDVDLVLMLIYTGFRSGEFIDILISNIDTDNWTITGGKKTKAGKNRIVPVHEAIRPFILERIYKAKGDKLLNIRGNALRNRFKKVMQTFGMDHIPHECRHTLRTLLDNAGANRTCIDLILGHVSGNTGQDVYTHKTIEQLHEAINSLKVT